MMKIQAVLILALSLSIVSCASRNLVGDQVGIGAIAGRSIGNAGSAIVSGSGVGQGIGYLIADETDRSHASALTKATAGSNFSHNELGALTNTRWRVRSLMPQGASGEHLGMVVTFRPSGHLVTRTIMPDSTSRLVTERYRVVGDTLIINSDDYVLNAQYRIRGEVLTIGASDFVGVFDRIRSRDGL